MPVDRLAIVTGTTSGLGAALASDLIARGWHVLGLARRQSAILDATYDHLAVDLSDPTAAAAALERPLTERLSDPRWQRIGLVNNAARADLLGPLERIPAGALRALLALNVVTPMWLMGLVVSRTPKATAVRVVNVSTGAAVNAFPGLAAYGASKAALRMAGAVLAAEFDAPPDRDAGNRDAAILSYEPGTVDTPMQAATRAVPPDEFPWGQIFQRFHAEGLLVEPSKPAAEIADFLESDPPKRFTERRFGRRE